MKLHNPNASIYIPDNKPLDQALPRITHLGVGAHQDDLEFMAFHGIIACYHSDSEWFGGVTCTDGAGSARIGNYAKFTDDDMKAIRVQEQNQAALVGRYGAMFQLDYPSKIVKDANDPFLKGDLLAILQATKPRVIYTHNPADKHDTHIAVVIPLLEAIREMPVSDRPEKIYGCEVWRNLDWLMDDEKVAQSVGGFDNLAAALNGIFDSQIAGGKRYDLAVIGRRRANATFFDAHATDDSDQISFAMDLSPLAKDESLDIIDYVTAHIDRFKADVIAKIGKRLGK